MSLVPRLISVGARLCFLAAVIGSCALTLSSRAQYNLSELPEDRQGVDVFEHRGEMVPLDTPLTNAEGDAVTLADYFDGTRPVVLILGYYSCPLLCDIVFHKAQEGFNDLAWTLGKEYRVVTISIDPDDTPALATQRQESLHSGYKLPIVNHGWDFLVGEQASIDAIASAVGFSYKVLPEVGQFSHPAALTFLTPDGEISNYLIGLVYPEKQLRLALTDASQGRVGSLFDRVLLYCHVFDPNAGAYVWHARTIMNIGAIATVIVLATAIGVLLLRERSAKRARNARKNQLPSGVTPQPE
jgi:protein SCO1